MLRPRKIKAPRSFITRIVVLFISAIFIFVSLNRITGRVFAVGLTTRSSGYGSKGLWREDPSHVVANVDGNATVREGTVRPSNDDLSSGRDQKVIAGDISLASDDSSRPSDLEDPGRSSDQVSWNKDQIPSYITSILDPTSSTHPRLYCPSPTGPRYTHLQNQQQTYFFAIDLHQSISILPRLLGSILETIRYLGPTNCVLSIVEGRSTDGTAQILSSPELRLELKALEIRYYLQNSDLDPILGDDLRVRYLAELRNLALAPLYDSKSYDPASTTIVFLNDVAICMEDILELIHQKKTQGADMVCGMDWTYVGPDATFYDVWIARDMKGAPFFNINSEGSWDEAWNLFPDNPETKLRHMSHEPFQVYSCWNGGVVMSSEPFLAPRRGEGKTELLRFRGSRERECFQGEPQLLCKDMWFMGYRKIAVVPSVNIGYTDDFGTKIKQSKGYVSDNMKEMEGAESSQIDWQLEPPEFVKCWKTYSDQKWLLWNESLA